MAVAHDFASESHTGAIGSISQASFTWSHNPVGVPKGVLVFVMGLVSNADDALSVTYDGVDVPAVVGGSAAAIPAPQTRCKAFFLGSGVPTTDPANVVVTRNNNANELWATSITATAAGDTEVTGVVLVTGTVALAEQSVDDGSPGTNSLRYAGASSGLNAFPPAGANSTVLFDFDTGNETAAVVRETTAGQGSRPVGFASASDSQAAVHLAIREAAVAAGQPPSRNPMTQLLAHCAPLRRRGRLWLPEPSLLAAA